METVFNDNVQFSGMHVKSQRQKNTRLKQHQTEKMFFKKSLQKSSGGLYGGDKPPWP